MPLAIKFKIQDRFLETIESGEKKYETRELSSVLEKLGEVPQVGMRYNLQLVSLETGKTKMFTTTLVAVMSANHIDGLDDVDIQTKLFGKQQEYVGVQVCFFKVETPNYEIRKALSPYFGGDKLPEEMILEYQTKVAKFRATTINGEVDKVIESLRNQQHRILFGKPPVPKKSDELLKIIAELLAIEYPIYGKYSVEENAIIHQINNDDPITIKVSNGEIIIHDPHGDNPLCDYQIPIKAIMLMVEIEALENKA